MTADGLLLGHTLVTGLAEGTLADSVGGVVLVGAEAEGVLLVLVGRAEGLLLACRSACGRSSHAERGWPARRNRS